MLMLIFICAICSMSLVHSMDRQIVMDDKRLVWDVVLRHGVKWFNYVMINEFAASSKECDLIVHSTADCRKKYLTEQLRLPKSVCWHKYGAMCGHVSHDVCLTCFPKQDLKKMRYSDGLIIKRFYLNEYGSVDGQPCVVSYSSFNRCLPCSLGPFFNLKGDFCFYGYERQFCSSEDSGKVIGYYLSPSNKSGRLGCWQAKCITNIKDEKSVPIGLEIFLEFPVLLNAFLRSSIVYRKRHDWDKIPHVYAIKGVTVPENYKYHKQYFSTMKYNSFDDLPQPVRLAIIRQYHKTKK